MAITQKSDAHFSRLYVSGFMIVMLVALAVLLALQFARQQYDRDMRGWQVKLSLIADSRLNAVDSWLEQQFTDMGELAANPQLRSFVAKENAANGKLARDSYLRQLLKITSERAGFIPEAVAHDGQTLHAGGIALLDNDARVLLATEDMPAISGHIERFLQQAEAGQAQFMDIAPVQSGAAMHMGFLVPVFAAKEFEAPERQIGWVFGVREANRDFFALLQHPGVIEASLENVLVREENGGITYLTPLMDGTAALRKHLSQPASVEAETALAGAFAQHEAGSFAIRTDYRMKEVLVTGRNVPGTDWTLVTKVDKDEAMATATNERNGLVLQLLLAIAVVLAVILAAWRHGSSRNAVRASSRLEQLLRKAESRKKMLEVITDTQPGSIFIVDKEDNCRYANIVFAERIGVTVPDVIGRNLGNLVGAALAAEYDRASEAALKDEKTIIWTRREHDATGDVERVFRVKHIPLTQLPVDDAPAGARGVLVLEQDITALVVEREKRVRTLRGLIDTLVAMVDRRDPYAANHSKMVATIARKVAEQMDVEPLMVETAEIAGTLMNIGKMVVPAEWLTKSGALNDKERTAIRDSLLESATMLEGVEFDGPVAETLRQTLENWDGSGPQKLKGEQILVSARIVAASNAFVGMVSPRSYRKAMSIDKALDILMEEMDKAFDRKVIIALANYIDNRGGRAMIADLAQEPTEE